MIRLFFFLVLIGLVACDAETVQQENTSPQPSEETPVATSKMRILLDTDANNELDDQHAIAYLIFNKDIFDIEGITVNATRNGGDISQHVAEARRVMQLCNYDGQVPLVAGANGEPFDNLKDQIGQDEYSGKAAVDFIIERAHATDDRRLILVPVGSLTNIALALEKDPSIAKKVRVVWLGSNWPAPGEYNLDNDTTAVNPLLNNKDLDFEIVTVRYNTETGTTAVRASVEEIRREMKGLGPTVAAVEGRHGDSFTTFGDYSIELFEKIGDEERSLFDVCALSILKNPDWAEATTVPAPLLVGNGWKARPDNARQIIFWENFDKEAILADFYESMRAPAE